MPSTEDGYSERECPACKGQGIDLRYEDSTSRCPVCKGKGRVACVLTKTGDYTFLYERVEPQDGQTEMDI